MTFFADTFYFLAMMSPRDPWHELVIETAADVQTGTMILTTGWVVTEVGDAMCSDSQSRRAFIDFAREIDRSPGIRVIGFSDELYLAGLDLYARRPDKQWSLTDCISFVVMEREHMTDALTGDKHFEQAGFNILLK